MSSKVVRSIREPLKKPRPLKTSVQDTILQKSREEILDDLEILNLSISNCSFDEVTAHDITRMCAILKKRGEEMDSFHKEALDRFFCTLRNASREERLDIFSRLKLLEIIEKRGRGWKTNEKIDSYFNLKHKELEQKNSNVTVALSPTMSYPLQNQNASSAVPLASGEILRSSGKFEKPTKISGKNYFKDEIVIRNSDSGKVNPGVRDRLVQITGPHEEAISHAKLLVEDTIRRNASPIRDTSDISSFENAKEQREFGNSFSALDNEPFLKKQLQHSYSMSDATLKEYNISLQIGDDLLTLTGTNAELLQTAKLVLKEYFAGQSEHEKQLENMNRHSSPDSNFQRFELTRQSSLRSNMGSYSSWNNKNNLRRDSVSPFSSSDDDIIKEPKEKIKDLPLDNFVNHTDVRSQGSFTSDPISAPNKIRSSSLPTEMLPAIDAFSDVRAATNDEVFSPLMPDSSDPPIPPPSYQKKLKYSRDFLMRCAKSPFSHNQPEEYARIHHNYREIICQSPVMFDPEKYEESWPPESLVNEI